MKLKTRFCFCTSTVAGDDSNNFPATTSSSSSTSPASNTSLQSHLSLQTLPSVPSLQYFSLLDVSATVTLTHSLSSTLSLPSSISSLSLSSASSLLYVSSGHQINVYDSSTLSLIETFNSDGTSSGAVKSVTFSDGKIFSAHQDGKIRVWKLTASKKHKMVSTLPTLTDRLRRYPVPKNHVKVRRHKTRLWVEHNDAVSSLAVTNGKIYSVSWDKTLKVWGPKSLRCYESVTAHEDAINAVIVANDGTVYTGSADGRIRVWAKKSGSEKKHSGIATLEKHKSAVNALALNSDGSILFSGACDRSILVWEREDSAKYMVVSGALRGHNGAILCLINVSDFLISGSADRTVRIWRRGFEGKFCCLSVLTGHSKPVKSLAAKMEGEDGISVFSGGLNGEIKVWSLKINYSGSKDS
ncbi:protein JINGUBANG-like [Chenopodium quinoa]|uniref:Uncharacterized protein n=1 Tax=Chenopodium quinoa TaxID=63459 RepID=A0A803M6Z6_CHEQI|nr:protein JINGUBANG-like [Chenopodium quinoa]